jgi:16S rRNA (cytosine967-C5)-methyltransferase
MPPAAESPRTLATRAVHDVAVAGRSLDRALDSIVASPERALVTELAFGTIRHYYSLASDVRARLATPLKARERIVECALLVGAYQIRHTRVPPYAAVSESVRTVVELGRPWAKGLTNALLRRLAREAPIVGDEEAALDQPSWIIDALRADRLEDADTILRVSNERAPMSLRVNRRVQTRDAYRALLTDAGIAAQHGIASDSLRLDTPRATAELPGFASGSVSVQDEGAQLAPELMPLAPGMRVLDACAAPGGKTFHMLEREPASILVALDAVETRCAEIRAGAARLRVEPIVLCGDGTRRDWWDGNPFDAILVDAPCSGTGTLRRHPDIRLLKHAQDLPVFAATQFALLANLWGMLRLGGTLLYCTCSMLSVENDAVIGRFLAERPDAECTVIDATWGVPTLHGRQLFPSSGGPDGFYYARLRKRG